MMLAAFAYFCLITFVASSESVIDSKAAESEIARLTSKVIMEVGKATLYIGIKEVTNEGNVQKEILVISRRPKNLLQKEYTSLIAKSCRELLSKTYLTLNPIIKEMMMTVFGINDAGITECLKDLPSIQFDWDFLEQRQKLMRRNHLMTLGNDRLLFGVDIMDLNPSEKVKLNVAPKVLMPNMIVIVGSPTAQLHRAKDCETAVKLLGRPNIEDKKVLFKDMAVDAFGITIQDAEKCVDPPKSKAG